MTLGESASGSSLSAGEGLQAVVGGRESQAEHWVEPGGATISGSSGESAEPSPAALSGRRQRGSGAARASLGQCMEYLESPSSAVGVVFGSQWGALKIILMMLTANTDIALTLPPAF